MDRIWVAGHFLICICEQVKAGVKARLASDDEISVEVVDDIAPAPSGKYRPVIGRIAQELMAQGREPPRG